MLTANEAGVRDLAAQALLSMDSPSTATAPDSRSLLTSLSQSAATDKPQTNLPASPADSGVSDLDSTGSSDESRRVVTSTSHAQLITMAGRGLTLPIISNTHSAAVGTAYLKTTPTGTLQLTHRRLDTPTTPSVAPHLAMRTGNSLSVAPRVVQC